MPLAAKPSCVLYSRSQHIATTIRGSRSSTGERREKYIPDWWSESERAVVDGEWSALKCGVDMRRRVIVVVVDLAPGVGGVGVHSDCWVPPRLRRQMRTAPGPHTTRPLSMEWLPSGALQDSHVTWFTPPRRAQQSPKHFRLILDHTHRPSCGLVR